MHWNFQSALPGVAWPAVPDYGRAAALALLHQIEQSQWHSSERLEAGQFAQLTLLLRHAWETTRFYRDSWAGRYDPAAPLAREVLAGLPLLSRGALQKNQEGLKSRAIPPGHGQVAEALTTGSTGTPVRVLSTEVTQLFWNALTLRDHLWHKREMHRKLAVVRGGVVPGDAPTWGPATAGLVATGPAVSLGLDADVDTQLDWLVRHDPGYLLTYPSNLAALAKRSRVRGLRLPGLLEVRTLSEALEPDLRALCKEAWDVRLVDLYSAREVGYIALQCPQHEHYHVQSESLLVEILDDAGRPCAPGEVGRVVVTDLHNFAMPLVRYDIGDYAEVGEACGCGRNLPVLRRIVGRVRNMLVTADGRRFWPTFGQRTFAKIATVLQHQFVQKAYDLVEARLVTAEALSIDQTSRLQTHIAAHLPAGIRVAVVRVERIPRGAGGKFEDFVCEVAA